MKVVVEKTITSKEALIQEAFCWKEKNPQSGMFDILMKWASEWRDGQVINTGVRELE